jgi:putative ABC transport system ATP-binding protein
LPSLNLLQNILLPMDFVAKKPRRERLERARYLLQLVGLSDQAQKLPSQVSGGQQQRAAIARALANDPQLIVADEPTGNLDEATADAVFELFLKLNQQGKTLVMVTHNETLAESASRRIVIHSGRISDDQIIARSDYSFE